MTPAMFLLVVFAVSLGAGLLGSLLGLGGGIIVIPVLTLLLHVDIRYAIGASIISVIATSSGAAATYGHVSFVVSDTGIGISGAIGLVGFTGASVALADGADVPGIAVHMVQHNGHMGGGPGTTQGTDTGPYHDQMQAAAATALGITADDLNTQLAAVKTIAQIAQERGVDLAKVQAAMQAGRPACAGRGMIGGLNGTGPANGTGPGDCPYAG